MNSKLRSDCPVVMSARFLDYWLMWEGSYYYEQCHPWADEPRLYESQQKQASRQWSSLVSVTDLASIFQPRLPQIIDFNPQAKWTRSIPRCFVLVFFIFYLFWLYLFIHTSATNKTEWILENPMLLLGFIHGYKKGKGRTQSKRTLPWGMHPHHPHVHPLGTPLSS